MFSIDEELNDLEASLGTGDDGKRLRELIRITDLLQADGLITLAGSVTVDLRQGLYQKHRMRVLVSSKFGDVLEIIAHGHSIFWALGSDRRSTFNECYGRFHWKAARYMNWFTSIQRTVEEPLRDHLRSCFLNRVFYLLYARDMMRFYEIQRDHYVRRGHMQPFTSLIGYHLNMFYHMLWGMLDQLTVIAKYRRGLVIDERKCSVRSKEFWKEFGEDDPLARIVREGKFKSWIDQMADARHAGAHRVVPVPTSLVEHTPESLLGDAEILERSRTSPCIRICRSPQHGI